MRKYFDLKFTCNFVCFYLKRFFFLALYIFGHCLFEIVMIVYRILWVYSKLCKKAEMYRTTAKAKLKPFVTKVNSWKLLNLVKKSPILDFAVVLDTSLKGRLLIIWFSKKLKITKQKSGALMFFLKN